MGHLIAPSSVLEKLSQLELHLVRLDACLLAHFLVLSLLCPIEEHPPSRLSTDMSGGSHSVSPHQPEVCLGRLSIQYHTGAHLERLSVRSGSLRVHPNCQTHCAPRQPWSRQGAHQHHHPVCLERNVTRRRLFFCFPLNGARL